MCALYLPLAQYFIQVTVVGADLAEIQVCCLQGREKVLIIDLVGDASPTGRLRWPFQYGSWG